MARFVWICGLTVGLAACQGKSTAEPEPGAAAEATPAADKASECIYVGENAGECPATPAAPSGDGHFGAPFQQPAPTPLAAAIKTGPGPEPVLVRGTVDAVCQKKGCWMVIKDGAASARVMMANHAFTVPMDTRGKPVQVEGTLSVRTFSKAQARHLEEDRGGDPDAVTAESTEHLLMATGVRFDNS